MDLDQWWLAPTMTIRLDSYAKNLNHDATTDGRGSSAKNRGIRSEKKKRDRGDTASLMFGNPRTTRSIVT